MVRRPVYFLLLFSDWLLKVATVIPGMAAKEKCQRALVYDDLARICESKENLEQWLRNLGLIGDFEGKCSRCEEGRLRLRKDKGLSDGFAWRCPRSDKCTFRVCIRAASWFEGSKLPIDVITKLTYSSPSSSSVLPSGRSGMCKSPPPLPVQRCSFHGVVCLSLLDVIQHHAPLTSSWSFPFCSSFYDCSQQSF